MDLREELYYPKTGQLTYSWILNEYPSFVKQDKRRFVSQETGNLYIAKVEPSDVGNYTCVVTNTVTKSRVHGPPTPLVLRTDVPSLWYNQSTLLGLGQFLPWEIMLSVPSVYENSPYESPVPTISWRRVDGIQFSRKVDLNKASRTLEIPYFQQEDAGSYECLAENSRGKNTVKGKLTFYAPPHLTEKPEDVQKAIDDSLLWECKANGKPKPSYRWMKNGEPLEPLEERIQVINGALSISRLTLSDMGMYQCVASNKHGEVYTNAELRVMAVAPDFSQNLLKPHTLVRETGDVLIECRPRMSPRGTISWRKGNEALQENHRISILDSGSLRISNVSKSDAGIYTCVARNQFGVASSTGSLVVKGDALGGALSPPSSVPVALSYFMPLNMNGGDARCCTPVGLFGEIVSPPFLRTQRHCTRHPLKLPLHPIVFTEHQRAQGGGCRAHTQPLRSSGL
ncbi:hypothetical protein Z043_109918 [Scleropages formosus]|uniref:Ig-like domain-containing protein n=1 Tax=Scleropages formosus TaxID=113540 RepID=A0A0P7X3E2_SCLFO|nr:hypothetical protein Z043_109918 [Scleropages formosus]